jgi:group II intron reverse transcriptase/maturase
VDDIGKHLYGGYTEVIDADLSKYFDTIPHDKLMKVVAERIVDAEILWLIKSWLKAPVIEDRNGKSKTSGGKRNKRGTPQGGVISPLLSNLYLNLLDRIWVRKDYQKRYGARLVRYADDLVILCRKGTDWAFGELKRILGRLDLNLNEKKTRVLDANRAGFKFLGFRIQKVVSRRTGKRYPLVRVSREAMGRIREKVRKLTSRERAILPLEQVMEKLNETIEGWSNYFHYGHTMPDLSHLRNFVEERLRGHLCRRYKVRGQGYRRFPWKSLYEMGLYKIPRTPAWLVPAHAL